MAVPQNEALGPVAELLCEKLDDLHDRHVESIGFVIIALHQDPGIFRTRPDLRGSNSATASGVSVVLGGALLLVAISLSRSGLPSVSEPGCWYSTAPVARVSGSDKVSWDSKSDSGATTSYSVSGITLLSLSNTTPLGTRICFVSQCMSLYTLLWSEYPKKIALRALSSNLWTFAFGIVYHALHQKHRKWLKRAGRPNQRRKGVVPPRRAPEVTLLWI